MDYASTILTSIDVPPGFALGGSTRCTFRALLTMTTALIAVPVIRARSVAFPKAVA